MHSVISVDSVTQRYPGQANPALHDVTLEIADGEIFGVIGESGAGKSTLVNLLTGMLSPTSGTVSVLDRNLGALGAGELRAFRHEIGVVVQGVHLLGNLTVRQNIALPLRLRGRGRHRAEVDEMIRFVGLTGREDDYPAQLSGGQQQRVGIARALVTRPRLLLCDEPTSALDASTAAGILDLVRQARDTLGTTVVVVTHDLAVVRSLCDRVALFEDGILRDILTVAPRARAGVEGESYLDRARRELTE